MLVLVDCLVGVFPLRPLFSFFLLYDHLVIDSLQRFSGSLLCSSCRLRLYFWLRRLRLRLRFDLVFLGCCFVLTWLLLLSNWSWSCVFALRWLIIISLLLNFLLFRGMSVWVYFFNLLLGFLWLQHTFTTQILNVVKFTNLSCVICFGTLIILESLCISQGIDGVVSWRTTGIDACNHYDFWWLLVQKRIAQYHSKFWSSKRNMSTLAIESSNAFF